MFHWYITNIFLVPQWTNNTNKIMFRIMLHLQFNSKEVFRYNIKTPDLWWATIDFKQNSFNTNNANQVNIMPPGGKKRRRRKRNNKIHISSKASLESGVRNGVAAAMTLEAIQVYVVLC